MGSLPQDSHCELWSIGPRGDGSNGNCDSFRAGGGWDFFVIVSGSVIVLCAWVIIGRCINHFGWSCGVYSLWNIWCLAGASSSLCRACLRQPWRCSCDSSIGGCGCSCLGCTSILLNSRMSSMSSTSTLAATLLLPICCTRFKRVRRGEEGLCTIVERYR